MNIINEYEEDGYKIIEYENGNTEKILISDEIAEEEQPEQPFISQQEIINAQIINELQYLKCLAELNSMKGGNL